MIKRNKSKILTAFILIIISISGVAFASLTGYFEGFEIVNVKVNGTDIKSDVPAVIMNGRTVLPVRAIAEYMNTFVVWDSKTWTVNLIKPEVTMCVSDTAYEDEFGNVISVNMYKVFKAGYHDISLISIIGPLSEDTYVTRIIIKDPDKNIISTTEPLILKAVEGDSLDTIQNSFKVITEYYDLDLNKVGNYTIEYQLKYMNEYKTIDVYTLTVLEE